MLSIALLTFAWVEFIKYDVLYLNDGFISQLFGSLIGGLTVGIIMLSFQRKMERTRYLSEMLKIANDVFSFTGVWRKNSHNKWNKCEFRTALGKCSWSVPPDKMHQLKDHSILKNKIEWSGVLYQADDKYIVSSKAIQDYSDWIQLVISGYRSGLLTKTDIEMLWRKLIDMFGTKEQGLILWVSYYLDGGDALSDNTTFTQIQDIILGTKAGRIHLEKIKKSQQEP